METNLQNILLNLDIQWKSAVQSSNAMMDIMQYGVV